MALVNFNENSASTGYVAVAETGTRTHRPGNKLTKVSLLCWSGRKSSVRHRQKPEQKTHRQISESKTEGSSVYQGREEQGWSVTGRVGNQEVKRGNSAGKSGILQNNQALGE